MRISLAWLADLVALPPAAELAEGLTFAGLEVERIEEVGDDTVFEINVTPNRADCLSHLGIAREVSARIGAPLRAPPRGSLPRAFPGPQQALSAGRGGDLLPRAPAGASPVSRGAGDGAGEAGPGSLPAWLARVPAPPRIDAPDRCGRYLGQAIAAPGKGAFAAPSPPWMQARLAACGVRPIGLAVDVTNYVMLELGQPLHAFDLSAVQAIVVRTSREGERLRTLDGNAPRPVPGDLLICDGERPIALAGVMGGEASAVTEESSALYLEAAWFAPEGIRRTARRLSLHTESSHRFERGVDPKLPERALERAVRLLFGAVAGLTAAPPQAAEGRLPSRRPVVLRFARVGRLLGAEVPAEESRRWLGALGFVEERRDEREVELAVPSWRFDVDGEVDLVEEIARLRGYDRIAPSLPGSGRPPAAPAWQRPLALARAVFSAHGFHEAVHYSFVSRGDGDPAAPVELENPLGDEQAALRGSLLPGLCGSLRRALAHLPQVAGRPPAVRLYESGRTYGWPAADERTTGPARERWRLSCLAYGPRSPVDWGRGRGGEPVDFFDMKGLVEGLAEALGLPAAFAPSASPWLHPRQAASLTIGGREAGVLGELHPDLAERFELPRGVFVAELSADLLLAAYRPPRFSGVPKFPAVLRDLALVVAGDVTAAQVEAALREAGGALLEAAVLFDLYAGPPLPEGHRSLAYSLRFRAADRTLTDAEVAAVHAAIVAAAREKLGARLRG